MEMPSPPSAYTKGYEKARLYDQAAADNYVGHTAIGDPALDTVMEELSSLPPGELHRFIRAGIEQQDEVLRRAPQPLRGFFENLEDPPWLDYEAFQAGRRAFHANVNLILVAFVTGVLVEGFSTLIAKSFKEHAGPIRRLESRSLGHAGKRGAFGVCHLRLLQAPLGVLGRGGGEFQ